MRKDTASATLTIPVKLEQLQVGAVVHAKTLGFTASHFERED